MRVRRPLLLATAALTASISVLASGHGAGADPAGGDDNDPRRAGNGSVSIAFTQEDTLSIDYTESFVPPGRIPITGDFLGDSSQAGSLEDIFWYTPGPGGDALWRTKGDRSWVQTSTSVTGSYTPIVGKFTSDDQKQDIFWYAPGSTVDYLWDFNDNGSITSTARNISGTYIPIKGYFTDDGAEDIIWYAPGSPADSWWDFNTDGTITNRPFSVKGTYTPVVARFSGIGSPTFDYIEDILWYAPGTAPDSLWDLNADGTIVQTPLTINGTYTPVAGNFSADGFNDIIWYAPGSAQDHLWNFTNATGAKVSTPLTINGSYIPITREIFETSPHETDILWFGPGAKGDAIWDFDEGTDYENRAVSLPGNLRPVLGSFEVVPYTPSGGGTSYGTGADIIDRTS